MQGRVVIALNSYNRKTVSKAKGTETSKYNIRVARLNAEPAPELKPGAEPDYSRDNEKTVSTKGHGCCMSELIFYMRAGRQFELRVHMGEVGRWGAPRRQHTAVP